MSKVKVVIIGGGFGGVFTAYHLARKAPEHVEIELINSTNYFVFQPLLPEVAAGVISAADAVVPLRSLLKKVKIRQADVIGIDLDQNKIDVVQGTKRLDNHVNFDHLVMAMGQQVNLKRIPGVFEHAFTMKNLGDAFKLRNHVLHCLELADVTSRTKLKKQYLTFVIVGGGFSGVETAGEVEELVSRSLKYYPHIQREEISFVLVEFADRLLNELSADLAAYTKEKLEKRGIKVLLKTGLKAVTHNDVELSDGCIIGTSTVVATVGNGPSDLLNDLPIDMKHGKIMVDEHLKVKGQANVWALGDAALIPLRAKDDIEHFAPPTAQFAVREGHLLANNILAHLSNRKLKAFNYKSRGSMASIGVQKGIAEIFGIKIKGFLAWLLWRFYYLSLIPGFATKIRIMTNWFLDGVIPRNTVQTQRFEKPGTRVAYFRKGDNIFVSGMHFDGLYVVMEGQVNIEINDTCREVGPGEYFGEKTMLAGIRARGVTYAVEDSKLLILDKPDFINLYKAIPFMKEHFRPTKNAPK